MRREDSVETIQHEMAATTRRGRAAAARIHPELSLVAYTFLTRLEGLEGCRATDLAAEFMLDKSTVSRQIAQLERLGFVERRPDPSDNRVQVLRPTTAGAEVLATAAAARRAAFHQRLSDWDEADLERFAAYLARYNAFTAEGPAEQR
jgi:DNA-binding MarR family transcriptional regulator